MRLSVIIPVHDAEPYLRECLDSLANQTFGDWEAVCVDDGSTDGSGRILDEYSAGDCRIKVVHQPNGGVSVARNAAIDASTGDWLAFLDADDTIASDWLERLVAHARDGVDIVHVDSNVCFNGGKAHGHNSYRTFLRDGWSVLNLVRREALGDIRYRPGLRFKEDVLFFTEIALKTDRIAWVSERGYNYRKHPGSAIALHISEDDCARFMQELARLPLPREDFARTLGYDLVLWLKGRDWSGGYDPANCSMLAFWREGIKRGTLTYGDVRCWWRPGLWRWVTSGDISWFVAILKARIRFAELLHLGR